MRTGSTWNNSGYSDVDRRVVGRKVSGGAGGEWGDCERCRAPVLWWRSWWVLMVFFFFSSRRRHTRYIGDWRSDVCSSDLVKTGVVEVVLEHLVEPDGDIDGRGCRRLVLDGEIAKQRPRGHGDVAHAALDEVARGHRLGKDHQVHRRVELGDLRQHAADLLEIGGILALAGADLGDRETGHGGKIGGKGRQRAARATSSLPPVAACCRPLPPCRAFRHDRLHRRRRHPRHAGALRPAGRLANPRRDLSHGHARDQPGGLVPARFHHAVRHRLHGHLPRAARRPDHRVLRRVYDHEHVQLREHSAAGGRRVLVRRVVHGRHHRRLPRGGDHGNGAGEQTAVTGGPMPHRFEGERTLMRIFIGESDKYHGKPLYEALLEKLRAKGLAGATVLRGVAGFGASSVMHTDKVLRLSLDLPLIIEIVETEETIQSILPDLDEMIGGGLVTLERARVILYRAAVEDGKGR